MSSPHEESPASVERIVEQYRPRLTAFIRRRTASEEDAEDVLQEVFYQLVRNLEANAARIGMLSAWMYRVAHNLIVNLGRKKRAEEWPACYSDDDEGFVPAEFAETLFDGDNPTPDEAWLRSLVWDELDAALDELPPEQREVFVLTELEGIPFREIADRSGVPINTLLSRKHYAVRFLRLRLRDLYDEISGR